MKKIPLHNKSFEVVDFALVSDKDFVRVKEDRWYKSYWGYAVRSVARNKKEFMHRVLLNAPSEKQVDHKDGNKLNCQRSNLRLCSQAGNAHNRKAPKNNTSGFKGVYWKPDNNKWIAQICISKQRKYLGSFLEKKEAAQAYNEAAKRFHGSFARLNIVKA